MIAPSLATVIRIRDFKHRHKVTAFTRAELNLLLDVYSRRVIAGEWKAYALDHDETTARFSIFTNAHTQPLYAVTKLDRPSRRRRRFTLTQGARKLAEGDALGEVLSYFGRGLRLVSG